MEMGITLGVDRAAERALAALNDSGRAWVVGDTGSGKSTLARRLLERFSDNATLVDLLDVDEPDAAIGGFYALVSRQEQATRQRLFRDWHSLREGFAAFNPKSEHVFIIVLPRSWERRAQSNDDWMGQSLRRAEEFIVSAAASQMRIVWVTSRQADLLRTLPSPNQLEAIPLPRPSNTRALLRTTSWLGYAPAAEKLYQSLDNHADPSPLAIRLAVGIISLGGNVDLVVSRFVRNTAETLSHLSEDFAAVLSKPANESCRLAVARLLLVRRSLPKDDLVSYTQIPSEHAPLVTDCVAYGDSHVRISSPIRSALLGRKPLSLKGQDAVLAHTALAAVYERLDGVSSIVDTHNASTSAWIEKHHHLALSDPLHGLENLPCREFYWARGRHLSITCRKYKDAAAVYEACVARFRDDSYAQHYLAFNLERAGLRPRDASLAYQTAVNLDPTNPWWNSRLVSFLIAQGEQRAAKMAWSTAMDLVDPDGEITQRDPWLGEQLHAWVARAWLEVGNVAESVKVLRLIPEAIVDQSERLRNVRQLVYDAVEADAIGESVYPRSVPIEQRWQAPRYLPALGIVDWFPGRIVDASKDHVDVVYASKSENQYQAHVVRFTPKEWKKVTKTPFHDARGYVELGKYENGKQQLVDANAAEPPFPAELPLAYFDRWHSPA